jgi:hypothetical protein
VAALAQGPGDGDPVEVGQADVEHDHPRRVVLDERQRLLAR